MANYHDCDIVAVMTPSETKILLIAMIDNYNEFNSEKLSKGTSIVELYSEIQRVGLAEEMINPNYMIGYDEVLPTQLASGEKLMRRTIIGGFYSDDTIFELFYLKNGLYTAKFHYMYRWRFNTQDFESLSLQVSGVPFYVLHSDEDIYGLNGTYIVKDGHCIDTTIAPESAALYKEILCGSGLPDYVLEDIYDDDDYDDDDADDIQNELESFKTFLKLASVQPAPDFNKIILEPRQMDQVYCKDAEEWQFQLKAIADIFLWNRWNPEKMLTFISQIEDRDALEQMSNSEFLDTDDLDKLIKYSSSELMYNRALSFFSGELFAPEKAAVAKPVQGMKTINFLNAFHFQIPSICETRFREDGKEYNHRYDTWFEANSYTTLSGLADKDSQEEFEVSVWQIADKCFGFKDVDFRDLQVQERVMKLCSLTASLTEFSIRMECMLTPPIGEHGEFILSKDCPKIYCAEKDHIICIDACVNDYCVLRANLFINDGTEYFFSFKGFRENSKIKTIEFIQSILSSVRIGSSDNTEDSVP